MIEIRLRPGERRILASPVGVVLKDALTAAPPLGRIQATIERLDDDTGNWIMLDLKPIITLSGLLAYPSLNRHPFPLNGEPKRTFRIKLTADFYQVIYPPGEDAYEFEAPAFNDVNPLPAPAPRLQVPLLPAPNYPFPSEVAVVRGRVLDGTTQLPVEGAKVSDDNRFRVFSDERGEYALPMLTARAEPKIGAAAGDVFPIDADHEGKHGTINVEIPRDLGSNQTIKIS